MQNHIAKQFFMTLLMVFLFAGLTSAATFKVDDDGDPSIYFKNLDTALWTAATYGGGPHQIEVYPGTYNDVDLLVPSNVDAIAAMDTGVYFVNTVTVGAFPDFTTTFLDVQGSAGLTISGLNISGYFGGIVTKGPMATDLIVSGCDFVGNVGGIVVASNGGTFDDNTFTDVWTGVYLFSWVGAENIDDNAITNSAFHDISKAPAIMLHYDDNTFMSGGNPVASLDNNVIDNCVIDSCSDHGIGLAVATETDITNCEIFNCVFSGISAWGGSGNMIKYNDIHQCAQDGTNPDSTALTWGGPAYGAIGLNGTMDFDIDSNTVYDNGGLGTYGNGSAFADYAVALSAGTGSHRVRWNCFYGHAGVQGEDLGDGSNFWRWNYYEGLASTTYALDGTIEVDIAPVKADNSVNDGGVGIYDVFDFVDFTVDWTVPPCDPGFTPLAAYNFTVTYDPAVLSYISGDYNYDFYGDSAFYGTIDVSTPGQVVFAAVDYVNPGVGSHELAFGQFQVIGIGNTSITIGSTYLDSLNNPIITGNTPLDLTLEDNIFPTISFIANNPVRDDIYSWGSPIVYSPDSAWALHVDITADDQYMLDHVWYQLDGNGWNGLAGSIDATTYSNTGYHVDYVGCPIPLTGLAGSDGTVAHTLEIGTWDKGGNFASDTYTFYVDWTGPVLTSWAMADPTCPITAGYTNDLTNNVTFVDDGTAEDVEFWSTGAWSNVLLDYATTTTFDFVAGDGVKSHYVRLYDEFNNRGAHKNATIILDQLNVTPTQGWASDVNTDSYPGKTKVGTRAVFADCNFDAAGGTLEYFISEDINDTACGTAWMAMVPPVRPIPFELSAGDAVKTIYFFARDIAGNTNYTTATIEFDSTYGEFLTFDINGGDDCSDNAAATVVDVTWDDVAFPDAATIYLSLDNVTFSSYAVTGAGSQQIAFSMLPAWAGVDSLYTVYGYIEDDVLNASPVVSDNIYLDGTDPTADGLELNGGSSTWSQVSEVSVEFDNPSADIIQILMGEVSGTYTDTAVYGSNTYDFGSSVTPYIWIYLYAQGIDCAGRDLAGEVSERVAFDFIDPVLSDVEINGGAAYTNDATVDVDFTWTEAVPRYVYFSEDAGMAGEVQVAWSGGPVYVDGFTFSGEGDMTLYVQIEDYSGRRSTIESATIHVDVTPPGAGTVTLQQDPTVNPWAAVGYTNDETIEIVGITYDSDVDSMFFRNPSGTWIRLAAAGTYAPFVLTSGEGLKTVEYCFRDLSLNYSSVYTAQITLDKTPSTNNAAGTFIATAVPSGSVDLAWTPSAGDDQFYFLRYNFTSEYPEYVSGVPPFPAIDEGFAGEEADPALAKIFGTSVTFSHPTLHDMFSFSIWAVDMAGNFSAADYAECSSINYFAGDFDFDGFVEFVEDFGTFATCYGLDDTDPLWVTNNANICDIGPTHNGLYSGMPIPDQVIGFDDLTVFGQNYLYHGDHSKSASAGKVGVPGPVEINIELPDRLAMNTIYTFPITVNNAQSIFAYHLVFEYDNDMIEVMSVNSGDIHQDVNSFFYHDKKSSNLDLTGMVLADRFSGNEIALVTIRAKNTTAIDLEEQEIVVRDMENNDLSVTVNTVAKAGLVPETFVLKQNYPNPFNPTTTISMYLPQQGEYKLCIYNVTGQLVEEFNGSSDAGEVKIVWNATEVSSGVYFYKASFGDVSAYKKMVLLK